MTFKLSTFALAAVFALGCGTGTPDDNTIDDPEANPQDFPAVGVSDACGGKCDDPNAVLNVSATRLLSSLDMMDYMEVADVGQSFALIGQVLEIEDEDGPLEGDTLAVDVYAADGAANQDFKISAELVFDGVRYVSESIDSSDLIPWQLLRVDVTGTHAGRDIAQGFDYAPGFMVGDEVVVRVESADPFAEALNVNLPVIYIDPAAETPDYERASGVDGFNLGGTEFWQRWEGGHSPTFSYSAGTEAGRKCMYASARRFEAIMRDAPESIVSLKENTNWGGSFFNWNDDYSDESANGRPRGAVLWAWRTSLMKWISQTGDDGACFLPTLDQVERAARSCQSKADSNEGEIEGCQAG